MLHQWFSCNNKSRLISAISSSLCGDHDSRGNDWDKVGPDSLGKGDLLKSL